MRRINFYGLIRRSRPDFRSRAILYATFNWVPLTSHIHTKPFVLITKTETRISWSLFSSFPSRTIQIIYHFQLTLYIYIQITKTFHLFLLHYVFKNKKKKNDYFICCYWTCKTYRMITFNIFVRTFTLLLLFSIFYFDPLTLDKSVKQNVITNTIT